MNTLKFNPAKLLLGCALALVAFLPARSSQAFVPFTFTLSSPTQSGGLGTTLTFAATLTNNTSQDFYLNQPNAQFQFVPTGGQTSVDAATPLPTAVNLSTSPFFSLPYPLGPNQSVNASVFDVQIGSLAATGDYKGTFQILGGPDGGSTRYQSSQPFQVTVSPSAVPEVGTAVSFGAMLLLAVCISVRRRVQV